MAPAKGKSKKKIATKKAAKKAVDNDLEYLGCTKVVAEESPVEEDQIGIEEEEAENQIGREEEEAENQIGREEEEAENQIGIEEEEAENQIGSSDPTQPPSHHEEEGENVDNAQQEKVTTQPQRKRKRGPTKMKNIARDPNARVKVDFTAMGQRYGPGSVKLSSYLGALVREHVPYNVLDWHRVSEDTKTVLWKSVQARFELDDEYQRIEVLKHMGALWRTAKSRCVTDVRQAETNQERMNLRPKNIPPNEWRKFVKAKTSKEFQAVSEEAAKRRENQIPHTTSRKGMVRLAEEMRVEATDPEEVTRLKVWIKSRTRKDGTPVNTAAAEKIRKAAEIETGPSSTTTNLKEDGLTQILGPDNPGRLRAMGRGMSMTKLALFEVKNTCMAQMKESQVVLQKKVKDLEAQLANMKRGDAEVAENSGPRSVNKSHSLKCVLVDWSGSDDHVAEGHILSSDPDDLVNNILLGPDCVKVLVETAIKPEAYLWRPLPKIFSIEEAVGEMIAWPVEHCIISEMRFDDEDIPLRSPSIDSRNKCALLAWRGNRDVVVAEGRWQSKEPRALVNVMPLGPNAVKVFVDVVVVPETFLWRPTSEVTTLAESIKSYVAWPLKNVLFHSDTDEDEEDQVSTPQMQPSSSVPQKSATTPSPPVKKAKVISQPVRRSPRKKINEGVKENQNCLLMDIGGKKRVVAEGRWSTNDPNANCHHKPLGPNALRVWVDKVKVKDAALWRTTSEMEYMEDAFGCALAWPEDKVVLV